MPDTAFASEFSGATYAQWKVLAEKVVKNSSVDTRKDSTFDGRLISKTIDGIEIQPLYSKAVGTHALVVKPRPWIIAQRMDHPDPTVANELCLTDLTNGANGLVLLGAGAPTARGFGLAPNALGSALNDVAVDLIYVRIDAGDQTQGLANELVDLALQRRLPLDLLNFDFGFDPIGSSARSGISSALASSMDTAGQLLSRCTNSQILSADGRPYHEAGASDAQELAFVVSTGLFYLRALENRGFDLDMARRGLSFLLAADADVFMTLCKFRALRRLWARVEEASGLMPQPIRLHAETAWRMVTKRDPHLNILRTTMATFAAGLGGADSITVLPFTVGLGLADPFARRIARNIQTIQMEESHLSRVTDPAEGSGAFEALTRALCERAWQEIQELEKGDGMLAALAKGKVQAAIASIREDRNRAIADSRQIIIGTTAFTNPDEEPALVLREAPCMEMASPTDGLVNFARLPSVRDSEPFEYTLGLQEAIP